MYIYIFQIVFAITTLVYKEIEASTKIPVLPNLMVLNSNFKSVFPHHLYFFLDTHSVHFVHIRYIKAYMNSGLILIL